MQPLRLPRGLRLAAHRRAGPANRSDIGVEAAQAGGIRDRCPASTWPISIEQGSGLRDSVRVFASSVSLPMPTATRAKNGVACGATTIRRYEGRQARGAGVTAWTDGYWWSNDGLRLHYRDYAGGGDGRPPILCLPGLTRNARDFASIAERLAPDWRLICVDLRGRGESAYAKDPMSYVPITYLHDLEILIAELRLEHLVLFGTSLGGMLSALLTATRRERVAGVLLNDIGPVLAPGGLARIRGYVGRNASFPTWLHAARALADSQRSVYPDYTIDDWLAMTKRLCRLTPGGRIVHDYDMRIAEPLRVPGGESGFDLWPAFESLKGLPVTLLRGALSDLLDETVAMELAGRVAALDLVTVPGVGHAPTLDEPESVAAIDRLLARVLAG